MSSPIVFERVTFRHGAQSPSVDLDLSLPEGKVTTIVGPSGSGKSTMLQLINGLLRPNSGTVSVFGKPIDYQALQTLRRRIGYLVQGTSLFPHLTIEQNIALTARIRGEVTESKRIDELMSRMGLPLSYRQRHPRQLSGGEQQRAAICMVLYGSPSILLMDESLGSLDAITRIEIQQQLLTLQAEAHYTTVLITHDMTEALRLGDQLLVLSHGNVEAMGTAVEVQQSSSELVQKLFRYSAYQHLKPGNA
ncbi:ATP-binding cassette domain-containing protein [Chryseolinea sp. T2]|uniref:ATP-binding cassette domain-containing protein n=1 Tax=Chryseolinea sp. T2 TaxID=3129255 RepID=UPI0030768859